MRFIERNRFSARLVFALVCLTSTASAQTMTTSPTVVPGGPAYGPSYPPPAYSRPPVYEGTAEGAVLSVRARSAVISLGRQQGANVGMNVVVYADDDRAIGDSRDQVSRRRVGVMRIIRVSDTRCEVELGFGERLSVGMRAHLTTATTTAHLVAPSRQAGVLEVASTLTVFAVRNDVGIGGLLGARVTYHGRRRYYLEAVLLDSGFSYRRERDGNTSRARTTGTYLSAGFDHRLFGLGVGVGVQRVLPATIATLDTPSAPAMVDEEPASVGFGYLLSGRGGVSDGLHFRLSIGFADFHDRFEVSYLDTTFQAPVAPGFFLVAHAASGFGVTGYAEADLGAKVLIRGNGGRGTLFVTPALGWARLATHAEQIESEFGGFDAPVPDTYSRGPAVRVGIELRR